MAREVADAQAEVDEARRRGEAAAEAEAQLGREVASEVMGDVVERVVEVAATKMAQQQAGD